MAASTHKSRPRDYRSPLYRLAFRTRYVWRMGYGGSSRLPEIPLRELLSTICRGRWPAGWTSGGTSSRVRHSNSLILKMKRYGCLSKEWWEFLLRLLPGHPGGIDLSYSEKAETLSDSLEAQFQPTAVPSVLAVIEMVDVALRSYFLPLPVNPS